MHRELTSGICKSGLVFIHVVWSSFRRGKKQKSKLNQVFSWRDLYTFSLFELKKNVMQLLSKAPKKKEKHNNFFSKTHQNPLLQLLIAWNLFTKKNSEKDAMCSSMWWNRQYMLSTNSTYYRSFADMYFQPNLHLCIRKKPQILGENSQLIAV